MWPPQLTTLPQRSLLGLVRAYRYFLSPWLGSSCRFTPSCSAYALDALKGHGAARGVLLTTGRLLRCHPWCAGGFDPVPETLRLPGQGLFTRWIGRETAAAPESSPPIRKNP